MFRSKYTYTTNYDDKSILIIDKGTDHKSVTNDIENVINDIISDIGYNNVKNCIITYIDSEKIKTNVKPIYDDNKRCVNVEFLSFQY